MKKLKPMGRRIQIEPEESNLLIDTGTESLSERGKVIAVGKDCIFAKVGDTLLFTTFGVDTVTMPDDKKYYFLLEDDTFILAKL